LGLYRSAADFRRCKERPRMIDADRLVVLEYWDPASPLMGSCWYQKLRLWREMPSNAFRFAEPTRE
jgi:hypothetical protein